MRDHEMGSIRLESLAQIRKLGRAAHLCSSGGVRYVVKQAPANRSLGSLAVRKLCGGSLPFRNEWHINNALAVSEYRHLRHPRLLGGKCGDHLIFQYIDGCDSHIRPSERARGVPALLELNKTPVGPVKRSLEASLFKLLERPPFSLLRRGCLSSLRPGLKVRMVLLLFWFSFKQRPLQPVLLHNDLAFSNILLTREKSLIFIDYEDSVVERKWVLMDYIDLIFDREQLYIDLDAAREYLWKLVGKENKTIHVETMIRLCLIRHAWYSAENPDFDQEERSKMAEFLEMLLHGRSYKKWVVTCPSRSELS